MEEHFEVGKISETFFWSSFIIKIASKEAEIPVNIFVNCYVIFSNCHIVYRQFNSRQMIS
uniref:Uncharacterized protein n=1 Tax=Onchocerca volvulus TaxID=6282 RepID=A0A8R1Y324_ONCVO